MKSLRLLAAFLGFLPLWLAGQTVTLDQNTTNGVFEFTFGVSTGPLGTGTNPPVTTGLRESGVTLIRTHDYYGPLDMVAMYPNQAADPALAASYNFTASDNQYRAIVTNGFTPYFRLGNSYTAGSPYLPTNTANFIEACVTVIRRYTNTATWGANVLRQVEIWNEPDNARFWDQGGTNRQRFYDFYTAVTTRLRAEFPGLQLGGVGWTAGAATTTSGSNYLAGFLGAVRTAGAPVDFLSWHLYSNTPQDFVDQARFYRAQLDAYGFTNATAHVSEWNTYNRQSGDPLVRTSLPGASADTAAFIAQVQEGVTTSMIYRSVDPDINAPEFYGLFYFDANPKAPAVAARLWKTLLTHTNRVSLTNANTNLWMLAGRADTNLALLISNPTATDQTWSLALASNVAPAGLTITDIIPTSTNTTNPNIIYWTTREVSAGTSSTVPAYGVQLVKFSLPGAFDQWAQGYGLTGTNAATTADPDGDGATNYSEYIAGTSPVDAGSVLRLSGGNLAAASYPVTWTAAGGRSYVVEFATSLASNTVWTALSSSLATGAFTDGSATNAARFYRLRVIAP